MKKKIKMDIECQSCDGTGVYVGMGEREGASVICRICEGTGKENFVFEYNDFKGRKKRKGIKRVYLSGMGYCIAPKKIKFEKQGEIDLTKEGVSYKEFLLGQKPKPIKSLGCPMMSDQSACHDIKGFVDECNKLNGKWINYIPDCKHQCKKSECWERFEQKQRRSKSG